MMITAASTTVIEKFTV